jgi:hypothetical protein
MPFIEKPRGSTRVNINIDAYPTPNEKGYGDQEKHKFHGSRHLQDRFPLLQ